MTRPFAVAVLLVGSACCPAADGPTVKVEDLPPPAELGEAVRSLFEGKAMTVSDDKGKPLCTVWAVKSLESKATAEQAKAGLRYTNIEESTVVGAVKFPAEWTDYRKQKIKPGVYTLRLAVQPSDGDHMGTAPYNDFCLICPAALDTKPELLEVEKLHELSAKTIGRKHPGMMLLFPNKSSADAPAVEAKPKEHWVLNYRVPVSAAGEKTVLGFSLVVIGQSISE
jgi:hypothetical protein